MWKLLELMEVVDRPAVIIIVVVGEPEVPRPQRTDSDHGKC